MSITPHHGYDQRLENPRLENPHSRSHVMRSHGSVYRQAYPYETVSGEKGLYFCAFSRFISELENSLKRMAGIFSPEDNFSLDLIFDFTTSIENNLYYVPSLIELEILGNLNVLYDVVVTSNLKLMVENLKEEKDAKKKKKKIFFENCKNWGYKKIFLEKKKVLESKIPNFEVFGNPKMPELSAFEVTTEDGKILWSKLSQPNGRNNIPSVFPTNEILIENYGKYLLFSEDKIKELIQVLKNLNLEEFKNLQTRVGIW